MIDPQVVRQVIDTVAALPGLQRHLEGVISVGVQDRVLKIEAEFLETKATLSDNDQIATYEITADISGNLSSFHITSRSTRSARFARTD